VSPNTTALGTVLVADDNQSAREVLEMMLRTHGYRVFAVSDGRQALQLLQQEAIDLALIDVVMPGESGFAVCRAAKDRPETRLTPIVLITGLGRVEDRIQGIEAGADDFLNKPVRKEELLARVKSLVRIKRFTDELESAETVVFTLAASIEAKDPYTEGTATGCLDIPLRSENGWNCPRRISSPCAGAAWFTISARSRCRSACCSSRGR
jgi:putative two-component system response regulator